MKNFFPIEELEVNELPMIPQRDCETGELNLDAFSIAQDDVIANIMGA